MNVDSHGLTVSASLTDNLGIYTEWFAFFPHSSDTMQTEHYLNGGFSRLIGNDIQWDIRAGFGFKQAADDFFAGTGFSVRYK